MENRTEKRRRVLKSGTIEFEGGAFSCMVRNLSLRGAALDVPALVEIPHEFTLIIPTDGLVFTVAVCGRKSDALGWSSIGTHLCQQIAPTYLAEPDSMRRMRQAVNAFSSCPIERNTGRTRRKTVFVLRRHRP